MESQFKASDYKDPPEEVRLSDAGVAEFEAVIEKAKAKLRKANEEALSEIYCKLDQHIETDTWMNYRTAMKQELAYANGCLDAEGGIWARNVRAKILQENLPELVKLLNQDHLAKIAELEDRCRQLQEFRNRY